MQQLYLSLDILGWPAFVQGTTKIAGPEWKRCYDYWQHADRLLSHGDEASYLIDCIANLNRAIDHRLKQIQSRYQFRRLPDFGQPKDILSLLGHLHIARPYMLHHINDLRNVLEHRYEMPPAVARCRELVELTWYFLKSTDALITSIRNDILFGEDRLDGGRDPWLELSFGPEFDWRCSARGWIPSILLHDQANDKAMTVRVDSIESATEYRARIKKERAVGADEDNVCGDIYFHGDINVTGMAASNLIRLYFSNL